MIYSSSKTFMEFLRQALALLTQALLVAPCAHQKNRLMPLTNLIETGPGHKNWAGKGIKGLKI
jgi:hypothetical protein